MGYDTDMFVDQNIDDNLICQVCREVLEDPVVACKEGHTFCKKCLKKVIAAGDGSATCPTCRGAVIKKSSSGGVCRPFKNMILAMKVKCSESDETDDSGDLSGSEKPTTEGPPVKKSRMSSQGEEGSSVQDDEDGNKEFTESKRCSWEGPLSELGAHHQSDCDYFAKQCPIGCGKMVICKKLEQHKKKCSCRKVKCSLCTKRLRYKNLARHNQNDCPDAPMTCLFCEEVVKRKSMGKGPEKNRPCKDSACSGHKKSCPKARVWCEFRDYGCRDSFLRKDASEHYNEKAGFHAYLANKVSRNANKRIDDILSSANTESAEILWEIPSVRLEGNDSGVIESKEVPFAGFSFYLQLHLHLGDEDNGGVALFICAAQPRFKPVEIEHIRVEAGGDRNEAMVAVYESNGGARETLVDHDETGHHSVELEPLEYEGEAGGEETVVTRSCLLDWISETNTGDSVFIRASFRVRKVQCVMVGCA